MKNPFKGLWKRNAKDEAEDLDMEKRRIAAEIKLKEERINEMKVEAASKPEFEQIAAVKRIKVLRNDIEGLKANFFNITKMQTVQETFENLQRSAKVDERTEQALKALLDVKSPAEFQERYDRLMAGRDQYRARMDAYEVTVGQSDSVKAQLTPEEEADLKDIQHVKKRQERAAEEASDAQVKAQLSAEEKALLQEIKEMKS